MPLPAVLKAMSIAGKFASTLRGKSKLGNMKLTPTVQFNAKDMRWRGPELQRRVNNHMGIRVKLAAQFLRDRVVKNISTPVDRAGPGRDAKGRFTKGKVVGRSKPGEYPRAETTRLMKDIFWEMDGPMSAVVGTTLDYGAYLEFKLDRSFLRRTLREQRNGLRRILLTPMK